MYFTSFVYNPFAESTPERSEMSYFLNVIGNPA